MEQILGLRNKLNSRIYSLAKKALFSFDPEKTHNVAIKTGKVLSSSSIARKSVSAIFNYKNPMLEQEIFGLKFKNPIGLSGGFDKNGEIVEILESVGFGFVEIGSVTAKPCKGNSGIRLKRIKERNSLWVNLGLNNKGARQIREQLKGKKINIPLGINVAKTNCKETVDVNNAIKDYLFSLKTFKNVGDYFTINISCPNAYGGQPFSDPELYEKLMKEVDKLKIKKPIFVKLSPDVSKKEVEKIIKISRRHKVDGFICTNLTKRGAKKSGGYSGEIVKEKSDELLSHVYRIIKREKKKYILIGSGGVSSAKDAYEKIKRGANLVQLITGMIYKGPGIISEINYGLVALLKKEGYKNIEEAIGKTKRNIYKQI